jgi:hypothetical protein
MGWTTFHFWRSVPTTGKRRHYSLLVCVDWLCGIFDRQYTTEHVNQVLPMVKWCTMPDDRQDATLQVEVSILLEL